MKFIIFILSFVLGMLRRAGDVDKVVWEMSLWVYLDIFDSVVFASRC